MKSSIIIGLVILPVHLAFAVETDHRAWKWEAPVTVDQPGMVRLEIPPAVLDVSERPNLDDLRILSPRGVETSCVIEIPRQGREESSSASGFKTMLVGKTTVIEVDLAKQDRFESLELVSPSREFIKSVTIAGRKGDQWQTLVENAVIFRQTGGAERMRIQIPKGAWEGIRFTIDDERAQPAPFTGVRLISSTGKAATVEYPVVIHERKEVAGETRLTLDLGARNLHVDALQFEIADAVFSRNCTFAFESRTTEPHGRAPMNLAKATSTTAPTSRARRPRCRRLLPWPTTPPQCSATSTPQPAPKTTTTSFRPAPTQPRPTCSRPKRWPSSVGALPCGQPATASLVR